MNVRQLRPADLEWADVILASAMLVQKESLQCVVNLCKAAGKKIVVGGPYVTTDAEGLPDADHLILGEAETICRSLCATLSAAMRSDFTGRLKGRIFL
jgi:radical SAM superfamily enzyme YgiQ (UPF0313 family)